MASWGAGVVRVGHPGAGHLPTAEGQGHDFAAGVGSRKPWGM